MRQQYHDVSELFDLKFVHGGLNLARCCRCGRIVELGTPQESVAWPYAVLHRVICDLLGDGDLT